MAIKSKIIPVGRLDSGVPLQESLSLSLQAAGFELIESPEVVNYNQVYAAVRSERDGKAIGSGWLIMLNENADGLNLVGGTENNLKERGAKLLMTASRELLALLSSDSVDVNEEWRQGVIEYNEQTDRVFGRGSIIKTDTPIIYGDGKLLSEVVVLDGQKGTGYTPEGQAIIFPRNLRDYARTYREKQNGVILPVVINTTTIPDATCRRIATSLSMSDLSSRTKEPMGYYPATVKSVSERNDAKTAILMAGNRILGTTAGADCIGIAAESMKRHNIEHGHEKELVMRKKLGPEIRIAPEAIPERTTERSRPSI
jgi:hypothetical protein